MGVLVMLLSSNASVNCPPSGTVCLPHEFDNKKYYRCIDGEPMEEQCVANLVFIPETGLCGLPW